MSLTAFSVRFQQGITGGFAPPIPTQLSTLEVDDSGSTLTVTSQVRKLGTPKLGAPLTHTLTIDDKITVLLEKLMLILTAIPPQYPGAMDMYRKDISIIRLPSEVGVQAQSDVPYGTAAALGISLPSPEQQQQFDEAVTIVRELVAKPPQC